MPARFLHLLRRLRPPALPPLGRLLLVALLCAAPGLLRANLPGGGTGTGPNVTLTSNATTATLSNGLVSILCTKAGATINQINYTYNNGAGNTTYQLLSGGKNGGQLYWETGGFGSGTFAYSVAVDPAVGDASHAAGDYAEIDLFSTSTSNGTMDVRFSMLRGSPGFYVTPTWSHRAGDVAMGTGEERDNIYISPTFTWNSIDATRNFQYNIGGTAVGVPGAPVEVSLWTTGIGQGKYEDKYKYSAHFGTERTWGWSSVTNAAAGFSGRNIGIWYCLASSEYFNGGPLKPELMDAPMVIMTNGGHYYMGSDSNFAADEAWTRVSGPYFIYCNAVSNTITNASQAANALFADARAQAAAEAVAWPYPWFVNPNYAPASNRGTVTGRIVISDSGNPNASAANLWVGLVQQPATTGAVYDFQQWMKPYQFWVQSDAGGNFSIPNVIAGTNYTLYAFGPSAAGTFLSQNQSGGNPPLLTSVPATPFAVTVTGGATTALGNVTWTPARAGPTVFEIGYPDRTARKFRHGEDWWVGDLGPSPSQPSPVWSKFLEYPFDFPAGVNYVVGSSRWSTDWNFIQPVLPNSSGTLVTTTSSITFNLASAPAAGAPASLYLGIASDYYTALIVSVNGTNLGGAAGVTAAPVTTIPSTGFSPTSSNSDTNIRDGINGAFSDERLNFPSTLLHAGTNTISIGLRQAGGTGLNRHAMYDYLRLELGGYVPPAPTAVTAYPGNNCNLLSWPAVPGATSYNLLRSATAGSGYTTLASGVTGPVAGSGPTNATFVDATAANGTTYYYAVQSVNPAGTSASSPASAGTAPSAAAATSAPAAPTGLTATPGNAQTVLAWTAPAGASLYTVQRATLVSDDGGGYNTLGTITLTNAVAGTTYTDTSPTNGSLYTYAVSATNAAGTGPAATSAIAKPLPSALSAAPATLSASAAAAQTTLTWSAVSGATGYILQRATSAGGPYTFVASITENTYTDTGLGNNTTYFYTVSAVNAASVSGNSTVASDTTAPAAPTGLAAAAGNTQVSLSWTAATAATSYTVKRGTATGAETVIATGVSGTTFTDTGLANGTPYFYVVASANANGTGPVSTEVTVTPVATVPVAPTGLTASPGNAQVALAWSASAGATSYTVKRATATGGPYTTVTSSVATNAYTDTGRTNGTTYFYVVAATNAGGTGANSTEASATPVAPPAAPTGLTATPGNTQIALAWSASTGATSYAVLRSTTNGSGYVAINSSLSGTSFTDTGLANGTTYYYVLTATNLGGTSGNSTQASATPLPPPPATPTGLTATPGNAQIGLTWSADSGATSYALLRSTTNGSGYATVNSTLTSTSFTDTGLSNGTTYYYVLNASNLGGTSGNSTQASATPLPPPPPTPTGLTATPGNAQVGLSWSASPGAASYTVRRSTSSGSGYITLNNSVTTTTYSDTGLSNGTTYFYVVAATNLGGSSGNSIEASATPLPAFNLWIAGYFPGVSDPAVVGPAGDPDHDGLPNLLEYFLGTGPNQPDPAGTLTSIPDGHGNLVLTFRMAKNLAGVTYAIQQSTDLATWTDTGVTAAQTADQGAYLDMQATVPQGGARRLFLRLVVTAP